MSSETLRCLRDPDCKEHAYHAGHIRKLAPLDLKEIYEVRKRRKNAGRRAWSVVNMAEKYLRINLTPLQRGMLTRYIRHEIQQ